MKKIIMTCALLLSVLLFVSCDSESRNGRYGGTDINGLTADAVVKECYGFFEKNDVEKNRKLFIKRKNF